MSREIGVFGGTFDPVHNGHLAIARSFIDSESIEELRIVPAGEPPHKNGEERASFTDRMNMLELAFEDWKNVVIDPIEENLPKPSYTLQTIRTLKDYYPDCRFYLCMGSDSLASFDQWHRYKEILAECSLLAAKRPGFDAGNIDQEFTGKIRFVDHRPIKASSTKLREKMAAGQFPVGQIPEKVSRYIKEKGLYRYPSS